MQHPIRHRSHSNNFMPAWRSICYNKVSSLNAMLFFLTLPWRIIIRTTDSNHSVLKRFLGSYMKFVWFNPHRQHKGHRITMWSNDGRYMSLISYKLIHFNCSGLIELDTFIRKNWLQQHKEWLVWFLNMCWDLKSSAYASGLLHHAIMKAPNKDSLLARSGYHATAWARRLWLHQGGERPADPLALPAAHRCKPHAAPCTSFPPAHSLALNYNQNLNQKKREGTIRTTVWWYNYKISESEVKLVH